VALLVSSIPAALPAAFALSAALGSRDLAARGVLVTRLSAIEDAASLDVLCSDKTGTLTANRLSVSAVTPLGRASREDVLDAAALASDSATQDPLDMAVLALRPNAGEGTQRLNFVGFDPATRRSEALVLRDGRRIRVVKGAPETLAALTGRDEPGEVSEIAATGARVLAVATGDEGGHLELIGLVGFADPPREDSRELIQQLHSLGVRVIMLTGDTRETARSVAAMVGIPGEVCRVNGQTPGGMAECGTFAEVFPEDKVSIVAGLQDQAHIVGMTGDGVNDAPALRRADVGIAVAAATDAAKSAASAVLTDPGLQNVVATVEEGRRIYQRILTYTLNKIIETFHIAWFLVLGLLITGDFVTTPSLLLIVLLANDFATLSIATDRAEYSAQPDRWTVAPLATASLALATGWVAFSLGAYFALRAAWSLSLGELQTLSFLLLVLSGQLTVLLVRRRGWAWRSRPGTPLILSVVTVFLLASLLAITGTFMTSPPLLAVLAIEAGTCLFALALDAWKVWIFRILHVR
jgi:H+-transporting ATPase